MAIRFFDMFAGIGGFRSGLEAVGGFECIGHCEIDKKANTAYCAIYDMSGTTRGNYNHGKILSAAVGGLFGSVLYKL